MHNPAFCANPSFCFIFSPCGWSLCSSGVWQLLRGHTTATSTCGRVPPTAQNTLLQQHRSPPTAPLDPFFGSLNVFLPTFIWLCWRMAKEKKGASKDGRDQIPQLRDQYRETLFFFHDRLSQSSHQKEEEQDGYNSAFKGGFHQERVGQGMAKSITIISL